MRKVAEQWQNFERQENLEKIERRLKKVASRTVLYGGKSETVGEKRKHVNASEYLKGM